MLMEETGYKTSLTTEIKNRIIYKAVLIRKLEELLLNLYSHGELYGTVHTCIGQEFSGAVISEFVESGDSIFSNHRCHGHFLAITENIEGLLAEIYGKQDGVCAGRGGSQHLCQNGFYSNGIQGGIVPISAGLALAKKIKNQQKISIVFIGDGTLGEGALYETLNLCSKWSLPIVFVLENNQYAQSTYQDEVLAGSICGRAQSFDIYTKLADTWNWEELYHIAGHVIQYTREHSRPAFLQINTYRLKAHSKGDDNRDKEEINKYSDIDPLHILLNNSPEFFFQIEKNVENKLESALSKVRLSSCSDIYLSSLSPLKYEQSDMDNAKFLRLGQAINDSLKQIMAADETIYFIGEDVRSPYGGAFKISDGLSDLFSDRVINTPISESAIVGTGIGLAMEGFKPIVEIMFGDFITLAMDQIINHAAKFRYMYNEQVRLPLMIRTPMGGGRGYGPTHSQTLDRHLLGIPGLRIVAINNLVHPKSIYHTILNSSEDPTIVIENKALYTSQLRLSPPVGFHYKTVYDTLPIIIMNPDSAYSDVSIVSYGGLSELSLDIICRLFEEYDVIAQFICPIQIYPFKIDASFDLICSNNIVIIEEGQGFAGFGAEVVAQIHELCNRTSKCVPRMARICSLESPIPASKALEAQILPGKNRVLSEILQFINKEHFFS